MFSIISLLFYSQTSFAAHLIYNSKTTQITTDESFFDQLKNFDQIILGEKHDQTAIQNEEAAIISGLAKNTQKNFTVAWEFLNWSNRKITQQLFHEFLNGSFNSETLLSKIFSSESEKNYAPILDVLKDQGGTLLSTNLSRNEKAPVVKSGLGALDSELLPERFEMGSDSYLKRFTEAMADHATPDQIKNFYEAQCLVDDVIALHLSQSNSSPLSFLIVGNFHTAYHDGVFARLMKRDPKTSRILVHLELKSDYPTEKDQLEYLQSPINGSIADFVIFAD